MTQTRRTIFILGMHRSGTSCLTGSLQANGVHLGDVMTSGPYNKKGTRESRKVMTLNDDVLRSSGGSWVNPPEAVQWNDEQRRSRDEIISNLLNKDVNGLKDPRNLFTLSGWREALPEMEFVGSFRDPWSVIASLRKRPHKLGDDHTLLQLWHRHNQKLIELWHKERFPLVNFNSSVAEYRRQVGKVVEILKLNNSKQEPEFFDPNLRTSEAGERSIPEPFNETYQELLKCWSESGSV